MFRRVAESLAVVVCLQVGVFGQLPEARTVTLNIRETADPASPVVTQIDLALSPMDQDGASVAWQVDAITVTRALSDGTQATWQEPLPEVISPDGLWWVDHADPQTPATEEFAIVPWMAGVAPSTDGQFSDLTYDLAADTYTPPPEGAPYEVTTSLSYALQASDPIEPVDDSDDDEPVEIPSPINDPHYAE